MASLPLRCHCSGKIIKTNYLLMKLWPAEEQVRRDCGTFSLNRNEIRNHDCRENGEMGGKSVIYHNDDDANELD